jgi:endo-1,4-beta-xylanase
MKMIIFIVSILLTSWLLYSLLINENMYLGDWANKKQRYMGTAIASNLLDSDPVYKSVVSREFTMVTPEYEMKFAHIHPKEGLFNFTGADQIVDFANERNMKVRGHTLVWQEALPDWIENGQFTKDQWKNILKNHIETVMAHYKGRLYSWDVVNEAFDDNGNLRANNLWYQKIGPEYIELAFQWAHQADPDVKLFYNDSHGEEINKRSDAIYNKIKEMKKKGIQIDGIGFETHISTEGLNYSSFSQNMDRFAELGLETDITELDVKIANHKNYNEELNKQADVFKKISNLCFTRQSCKTLVMWGFNDKYSWLSSESPLLFFQDYRKKPAYAGLKQGILY